MARFRFRLAPVLTQRERAERNCMLAVAELEREKIRLENHIRAAQNRIVAGRRAIADSLSGGRVELGDARLQAGATLRDDQDARRAVLELAGVMRRLEGARAGLIEAAARRRAIELLRDRDHARFKAEEDRKENNALDDLIVMRQRGQA